MRKICNPVCCSDRPKKVAKRASVEQTETAHNSLNTALTEAADKQSVNADRLTPRALRYARRSGGLVEPGTQLDKKTNSGTAKSTAASHNAVSASKTTDLRGQSSRKRRSTEPTEPETHCKKAKKESQNSSSLSNTNSSYKRKQESGPKKQASRRSHKNTVVRKQTHRHTSHKTSNLERGKEKAAKGDKASAKATAGQPSAGATAAARIPTKKHLQRSSATATASAETLTSTVTGETATASTSQSSRTATRRAATKRGGALLTSGSHLTDTTGSCASSK